MIGEIIYFYIVCPIAEVSNQTCLKSIKSFIQMCLFSLAFTKKNYICNHDKHATYPK